VKLIEASEVFRDGITFQTGAGGISLAVTEFLGDRTHGEAAGKRGSSTRSSPFKMAWTSKPEWNIHY
jgi:hypothetical protein